MIIVKVNLKTKKAITGSKFSISLVFEFFGIN